MRARKARRRVVAAAVVGIGLGVIAADAPASAADRALELVTPPQSDGNIRIGGGGASLDGDVVCFNAETVMAGAASNGSLTADDGFCASRTASGWHTEWVTGPEVRAFRGWAGAQIYYVSPDGERVAFASDAGLFPDYPGAEAPRSVYGTKSAFMWEDGETRWLAPSPEPLEEDRLPGTPALFTAREPLAVSEDLRHGIFVSILSLVPEDTNGVLDLYEWTPSGIRLVSRDADGNAVGGWPGLGTMSTQVQAVPGSVSQDGSRIFFEHNGAFEGSPPVVRSVFMREGDELTHVSPRRGPGPPANVSLAAATADGSIAYLLSTEQLTNEPKRAGNALYSYDIANDELSLVATAADGRGIVFLGVSADGSTLVYRTGASLPELFIRHDGLERSLGRLPSNDTNQLLHAVGHARTDKSAMRISADGEAVVFASHASFDGSPAGIRQVYRWTPSDGVRRISKDAAGSAPRGAAAIGNYSTNSPFPGETRRQFYNTMRQFPNVGRVMSDDARRIFFETVDPLVETDINGFTDVYEWHDGAVRLVSPGTQRADALYHDSSADGSTVFFTTMARLIPELDRNTTPDLYAAREGGGFPLPPVPTPCIGELCQGELQQAPTNPRPGSTTFDGPGDTQEQAPLVPRHTVARLTVAQRRAFARRGRTVLRVRANEEGVVTARVTARIARRNVVVARAVRVARSGATARLPLELSKRARTVLRTKRRLRLVISVSYSESDTTVRRVVVLRG